MLSTTATIIVIVAIFFVALGFLLSAIYMAFEIEQFGFAGAVRKLVRL